MYVSWGGKHVELTTPILAQTTINQLPLSREKLHCSVGKWIPPWHPPCRYAAGVTGDQSRRPSLITAIDSSADSQGHMDPSGYTPTPLPEAESCPLPTGAAGIRDTSKAATQDAGASPCCFLFASSRSMEGNYIETVRRDIQIKEREEAPSRNSGWNTLFKKVEKLSSREIF